MINKNYFRQIAPEFALHLGEGIFSFLLNVLGNWLSDVAGGYFGWSTGPITGILISVILLGLSMYAVFKAAWSQSAQIVQNGGYFSRQYSSQGIIFSLVTMLYSWCSIGGSLTYENTASLLISLAPYIQGQIEVAYLHQKISELYYIADEILNNLSEMFRNRNQPIRIHQNWLMNEMSKRSIVKDMNPLALKSFCAMKLKRWKEKDPDLEFGTDNNGLHFISSHS